MSEPNIAAKEPFAVEVEAGKTYYWCACGKSAKQPFCDGSHSQVPGFSPREFKIEEKKKVALCQCKKTANPPFCDGTHSRL